MERPVQRIEIGDFLLMAEIHAGIPAEQLAAMPRVITLAQSALAAPFAGFGDYQRFPAFHQKAAVYAARIATYHPLPDGNKRTAWDVMQEFIERNGYRWIRTGTAIDDAIAIEDVAAGSLTEDDFIAWAKPRVQAPRT